jgi:hypothetical protein
VRINQLSKAIAKGLVEKKRREWKEGIKKKDVLSLICELSARSKSG